MSHRCSLSIRLIDLLANPYNRLRIISAECVDFGTWGMMPVGLPGS